MNLSIRAGTKSHAYSYMPAPPVKRCFPLQTRLERKIYQRVVFGSDQHPDRIFWDWCFYVKSPQQHDIYLFRTNFSGQATATASPT